MVEMPTESVLSSVSDSYVLNSHYLINRGFEKKFHELQNVEPLILDDWEVFQIGFMKTTCLIGNYEYRLFKPLSVFYLTKTTLLKSLKE